MGGVIGATSGKFVLIGATLLLHGRVDDRPARIIIAPGAATSAASPALAAHRSGGGDLRIHLRAETLHAPVAAIDPGIDGGADLRLGQDVLNGHPLAIDFARHQVQPLTPGEARRLERRLRPVAVRHAADGSLSVVVSIGGAAPAAARLDLSRDVGLVAPDVPETATVSLDGVALHDVPVTKGPQPLVGLYAFRRAQVIFDLGHDRIWVRP